ISPVVPSSNDPIAPSCALPPALNNNAPGVTRRPVSVRVVELPEAIEDVDPALAAAAAEAARLAPPQPSIGTRRTPRATKKAGKQERPRRIVHFRQTDVQRCRRPPPPASQARHLSRLGTERLAGITRRTPMS